jgi:aspartokinase
MSAAASRSGGPAPQLHFERDRGVYRIDSIEGLAHVVVTVGGEEDRTLRISRVFRTLADSDIPVFLIKLHGSAVTFAVEARHVAIVESVLRGTALDCSSRDSLALVTVVATSMRDLTGVMVDIADSLQTAGARLYGVGDSHNTVQCLIDAEQLEQAVRELQRTFRLESSRA